MTRPVTFSALAVLMAAGAHAAPPQAYGNNFALIKAQQALTQATSALQQAQAAVSLSSTAKATADAA